MSTTNKTTPHLILNAAYTTKILKTLKALKNRIESIPIRIKAYFITCMLLQITKMCSISECTTLLTALRNWLPIYLIACESTLLTRALPRINFTLYFPFVLQIASQSGLDISKVYATAALVISLEPERQSILASIAITAHKFYNIFNLAIRAIFIVISADGAVTS